MNSIYDCIVIGGGQAGLAASYHLQQERLQFLLLEASDKPVGSWSQYYDSLTLFSPARYSSLPGFPFPGVPHRYPTRDEVVAYLLEYASRFRFPIRTNTIVTDVRKEKGVFLISTASGETFQAKNVIAATGGFSRPFIPQLPGIEDFQGTTLHSKEYKNPLPFQKQRIVVVGAGNSAVQIAVELAADADVTIATRSPILFKPQILLGNDIHFWVTVLGIDQSSFGKWLLGAKEEGVLDTGKYQFAIKNQKPTQREMFTHFTEEGIVWLDGTHEKVDAVIFATGYRPNVKYLSSLQALDVDGLPLHRNGISTSVNGLFYVGLPWQRSLASATLRGVGSDAEYVIKQMKNK
ncbi:NAD(P)/FAD-dependent oxidoreductase [Brevibacillus centrosporus]|uniref:flavin-containing monooxygenase n=1 Tax=Brevibacillus centrosporus TaxID=54910 RepID=UPI000F09F39A|nr:NAD(P)/FAD-dependent oxidoreductase [Brevibacillus centrosporus]MEC2131038.1 NAD(P)/FAD-dependent oxidoreductase [Brevibacillus centrosporus]RNB72897.1 NAD(P)/FAD-dependent oxidoreductase [Brevibacillus centrosporus]